MADRRYILGFSRKTHFFARAIQWFTRSDLSHCYVRQVDGGVDYVLEASSHGVSLQWRSVFLRDGAIVMREYEVVGVDRDALDAAWAQVCYQRLNRPYSYLQILGDAVVITRKALTGRTTRNPFSQAGADVCSELSLAWILAIPIGGFDDLDSDTVAPDELEDRAKTMPTRFIPQSLDDML